MAYPVTHFEIIGTDAAALQTFYRDTFDWTIDANNPVNYGMVAAAEGGISGGVGPSMDGKPTINFYIEVPDLAAALKDVEAHGGKTVMPPMDVPGGPSIAMFNDPEGNRIGLVKGM
ncbi:MAG TPA: VOC family protein [Acidimicrobiales bacterium]|jgi:hypothetical protein|nr:VOC family protein [Acidimicrobiales bacterium]